MSAEDELLRRQEAVALATQSALTARDIRDLHDELDALRAKVERLEADRDKAMRWGILALGSAVVGMGMWIFKLLAGKVLP